MPRPKAKPEADEPTVTSSYEMPIWLHRAIRTEAALTGASPSDLAVATLAPRFAKHRTTVQRSIRQTTPLS